MRVMIKFGFNEVEISLEFLETLVACGVGVLLVVAPLIFKAILLGLGV